MKKFLLTLTQAQLRIVVKALGALLQTYQPMNPGHRTLEEYLIANGIQNVIKAIERAEKNGKREGF